MLCPSRKTVIALAIAGVLPASAAIAGGWAGSTPGGNGNLGYNPYGGGWAGPNGAPLQPNNSNQYVIPGQSGAIVVPNYPLCVWVDDPIRDAWGRLIDVRRVQVCN